MSEDAPKAPRAKPPDPEPSKIDRDRLPRPESHEPTSSPPPSSGPADWRLWISRAFIAAGVLVAAGVLLNAVSSGGQNATTPPTTTPVPEVGAVTSSPTTETTPTFTTPKAPPKPKPTPPKLLWHREFTTDINTSFNIDRHHIANDPTGFEVTDVGAPSEGLQPVAGTKEAPWTGGKQPTVHNCVAALGGGGVQNIPLTTSGQWICVETAEGLIGTLRFDAASGGGNAGEELPYTFYVIAYEK